MTTVLITGCAGYIGTHLAKRLCAEGYAVRSFDRDVARLQPLLACGVEPIVGDVSDQAALRAALAGAEWVFHLAGSALGSAAAIRQTSVEGARNVAALCGRGSGVRALVFASSGALYPSGTGWLNEETPPAPAFGYAQAKYLAEQLLLDAHARDAVPVLIARIASVYGPDSPALMIPLLRRGAFPLIGGGKGYISSIHIDDLITALIALARHGQPGGIYNLCDDQPVPVRTFYAHLASLLQAPPPPSIAPVLARLLLAVMGLLARLRRRPLPLPSDLVDMAAVSHRMDNRRMRSELGITLHYPDYRAGLPTCLPQLGTPTTQLPAK